MIRFGVCAIVLGAIAGQASAGAALKAHLECIPAGGTAYKATQKAALDKDVICTIVVDGGAMPAGVQAKVTLAVTTPAGPIGTVAHPATAASDGKRFAAESFRAKADFLPCAGITIEGTIAPTGQDKSKPLWKDKIAVEPTCAAAKPSTAKLVCTGDSPAGIVIFPGSGDKAKAPLDQGLTCTINVTSEGDPAKYGVFAVRGRPEPTAVTPVTKPKDATLPLAYTQLLATALPTCKSFTIDAALLGGDGAVLWTTKLPIAQVCKK
jgi:hypothetical protein